MANYETIKIDKSMYGVCGRSLTQTLEQLDPSEQYRGTSLEGTDAFQRQLKRFDIKVKGKNSDTVEKFFQTSSSAALFPEYIRRAVFTGVEQNNVVGDIVAATTKIDGLDYRSIASDPLDESKELKPVAEGAFIPETKIKIQSNLVKLIKRGRMLVSSYEALRFQRLDLFTVTLKQIGAYIGRMQLSDAVNVLINGDGNNNHAEVINVATSGKLTYDDLLNFWGKFAPYELNTLLASTEMIQSILALPEMQDSRAGLDFHGTGKLVTPMGATLIHVPSISGKKIIGLDKNCALEMVQSGDIVTDYDKLIDRQLERAAITCTTGFSKLFTGAAKVLSI
ncbi:MULTISPECIES: phage major capsid protein [unclassified Ruminococcus]|uniref:phage major capsid protein n=1 Tax=unclassified Ruminococcus TaxID=2608920 RepID=UPI00210E9274|nr:MULTISPECIES: phage major capsid protein [unclassified Ruminococcus]MCQ4021527.1 phage major capsid protein [Ruminococcus sp. zg-924]MCQ4113972.1 phage major capsid protein [Ruminococcus sp. zg-921]